MGFIIANRDTFWPNLKVPYEIPESSFPPGSDARRTVLGAIRHINENTQVQLFDRNGRDDIDDYVEYQLSDTLDAQGDGIACHSPVGRQGGRQVVHCDATNGRSFTRRATPWGSGTSTSGRIGTTSSRSTSPGGRSA